LLAGRDRSCQCGGRDAHNTAQHADGGQQALGLEQVAPEGVAARALPATRSRITSITSTSTLPSAPSTHSITTTSSSIGTVVRTAAACVRAPVRVDWC